MAVALSRDLPAAPFSTLPTRFPQALREVLVLLRVEGAKVEEEAAACAPLAFARSTNRRVLGTMVEFAYMLKFEDVRRSHLPTLALWLAGSPCGAIGHEFPDRLTASLFGAPTPGRAWTRPVVDPSR